MIKNRKIKVTKAAILFCLVTFFARPAHSYVWPTIDMTQIPMYIEGISKKISDATASVASIQSTINQAKSMGDSITSALKYVTDLKETLISVKESIESVKDIIPALKESVNELNSQAKSILQNEKTNSADTIVKVESGQNPEEREEAMNAAYKKSEENLKSMLNTVDEVKKDINEDLDASIKALDDVVVEILNEEKATQESKEKAIEEIEKCKKEIELMREAINKMLDDFKDEITSVYEETVFKAYETYRQALIDYNNGKISKEEFESAGNAFIISMSSLDGSLDLSKLDAIINKKVDVNVEGMAQGAIDMLNEDLEYSDTDDEVLDMKIEKSDAPAEIHSFNYKSTKENMNAKLLYTKDGADKTILAPLSMICYDKKEDDIKDLKQKSGWLRNCITYAKGSSDNDTISREYDKLKSKINRDETNTDVEDIEINGIFDNILLDYTKANLITATSAKMYAAQWKGDDASSNSEYKQLKKTITTGSADNTLDAYVAMAMIDLNSPKLWSKIRRVDAINRAKDVIKIYSGSNQLYIDNITGNSNDVEESLNKKSGYINNKQVFPNLIAYHCKMDGSNVSVDPNSKNDSNAISDAEKNIRACLYSYAIRSGFGIDIDDTDPEKFKGNDETKQAWQEKRKMARNNALFEELLMAIISNYETTKDYLPKSELANGEMNIVTLDEGIKSASTIKDGYSTGAQVNYYATQQLLSIIDADAVNLQTEMMKDLNVLDYSYFGE